MNRPQEETLGARLSYFRRRYCTRQRAFAGPMDVVPVVNVALLLVLFFIVNSSFVLQPGVVVNLPTAAFADGAPYGDMVVTISEEGMVFFNDERTTVEGLGPLFSVAAVNRPDETLVIEADGKVRHSTIVEIYNLATAAGIKSVLLATRVPAASGALP